MKQKFQLLFLIFVCTVKVIFSQEKCPNCSKYSVDAPKVVKFYPEIKNVSPNLDLLKSLIKKINDVPNNIKMLDVSRLDTLKSNIKGGRDEITEMVPKLKQLQDLISKYVNARNNCENATNLFQKLKDNVNNVKLPTITNDNSFELLKKLENINIPEKCKCVQKLDIQIAELIHNISSTKEEMKRIFSGFKQKLLSRIESIQNNITSVKKSIEQEVKELSKILPILKYNIGNSKELSRIKDEIENELNNTWYNLYAYRNETMKIKERVVKEFKVTHENRYKLFKEVLADKDGDKNKYENEVNILKVINDLISQSNENINEAEKVTMIAKATNHTDCITVKDYN